MRRFFDDDSLIDSGDELRLTTVANGSAEEDQQQPSAGKSIFLCARSHKHQNSKTRIFISRLSRDERSKVYPTS